MSRSDPVWTCSFFVCGVPRPKGNHVAVCPRNCTGRGRPFITETWSGKQGERLREWTKTIIVESKKHRPPSPLVGAVELDVAFYFPRPKKPKSEYPAGRVGDLDKLLRAVCDAIQVNVKKGTPKGCLVVDDNQFCGGILARRYCDEANPDAGARITLRALEPQPLQLFKEG